MIKHYLINTLVDWRMSLKVGRLKREYEYLRDHPCYSEMTDEEIQSEINFYNVLGHRYDGLPKTYTSFQIK
ncbi:hypothetical protein [Bacillus cereus]|uniref:Uncharacterized protein n=1 Tax=Bacillus cereus (strain VD146) TaxID=1053236 RepID=R8NJG6_BACCX|nr:hypothetical protein [Bacillus cereus]EOP46635.1 hypothetical protein IK1_06044 [Bacillus cereus VD146]